MTTDTNKDPVGEANVKPLTQRWYSTGRVLYAMRGSVPNDNDRPIGMLDTPALAMAAVVGHNAQMMSGEPEKMNGTFGVKDLSENPNQQFLDLVRPLVERLFR